MTIPANVLAEIDSKMCSARIRSMRATALLADVATITTGGMAPCLLVHSEVPHICVDHFIVVV